MSTFSVYFQLGLEHILDVNGYDHILFVIALSALYSFADWKKVLILVTAFTIGHSITLALSVYDVVTIDSDLIEFLIPVTIFITAFFNIVQKSNSIHRGKIQANYAFALFFGLIHGWGFSNYLKSLMGKSSNVVVELLAFNVGLEVGQIVIVLAFLLVTSIAYLFTVKERDWRIVISSAVAGIALTMIMDKVYW